MLGRRSLNPNLVHFVDEPERYLRHSRSFNSSIEMAEQGGEDMVLGNRSIKSHSEPTTYVNPSCIRLPPTNGVNFEIKSSVINMLPQFHGLDHENPYGHLDEFLGLCTTFNLQNLGEENIRMRLFPFSLKDKARHWLHTLPRDSVATWDDLQSKFLSKFYPVGKTTEYREKIMEILQADTEKFHEVWDRFNELLRQCPHHDIPKWQLAQTFYTGLTDIDRGKVDAACGGAFMTLSADAAWTIYENLHESSRHLTSALKRKIHNKTSLTQTSNPTPVNTNEKKGIYELKMEDVINKNVDMLGKKLDAFLSLVAPKPPNEPKPCLVCQDISHEPPDCPLGFQFPELVNEYIMSAQSFPNTGQQFGNTYNPNWRNHPGFSWKTNPNKPTNTGFNNNQPRYFPNSNQNSNYNMSNNFQGGYQPPNDNNSEFRDILRKLQEDSTSQSQTLATHTAAITKFETSIGQLAEQLSRREDGRLPSQPEPNPRGLSNPSGQVTNHKT